MSHLNVVALVSGGKDSFFSILHCLEHGHKVVALANLYPVRVDGAIVEDSDSFMYQTIGHAVIPLYEQALGLPLYRQAIDGHAVSQTKTYDPQASSMHEDETEALVPLLRQVLQAHPEVTAISTGAILSDYQRTRVESVALRLGLTPISYLWQYPRIITRNPAALLEDMAAAGQDSRIIKVSSGGLDSSFLWQNVADRRTTHQLLKASQRFGNGDDGAPLGEGGEYETLAISGPAPLWKGRIVIGDGSREVVPGEAGTAALRLSNPTVETHHEEACTSLAQPPLFDDHFQSVFAGLAGREWTAAAFESTQTSRPVKSSFELIDSQTIFIGAQSGEGVDAASQMENIMIAIKHTLALNDHDVADIAYTSIILRDMADFPKINSVYAAAFTRPNPPARATIACADVLEAGQHLIVSVTSIKVPLQRREGLHVQSISYWAPANIGPYSQAITVPSGSSTDSTVTYIAGQIPLIPPTMQLDSMHVDSKLKNFLHQAVLSLQHLHRIALAVRVQMWKHAIAFIVATDNASAASQAAIARETWARTYGREARSAVDIEDEDGDETYDVWHDRYGANRPLFDATAGLSSPDGSDLLSRHPPALVVIQTDSLPRGAAIEWVAFGSNESSGHDLMHYCHLLDIFADKIL